MVIVPSFAERNNRYKDIVRWLDGAELNVLKIFGHGIDLIFELIFNARVILIVRLGAPNMSSTIHQPRRVQRNRVPQHTAHIPAVGQTLTGQIPWQKSGNTEAQQRHQPHVVSNKKLVILQTVETPSQILISLLLKHHERIPVQVTHINRWPLNFHIRMLLDHQPAHVREEHTAGHIVRIGIRVGELVMNPKSWKWSVNSLLIWQIH